MEAEDGDLSSNHSTLHSVILDRFLNLTWPPAHLPLLLLHRHLAVGEPCPPSFATHRLASAVGKKSGLTGWTPYRMNRKISANSNIMQHISPDDESTVDYKSAQVCVNHLSAKPKYTPASFGIASDFMQKDYLIPKPPSTRSFETTKPLKLDAKALLISEFSCEALGSYQMDDQVDSTMIKDMEDFLLQMLCDGFNIDKDTVGKVFCSCGYDMPKCYIEYRLNISEYSYGVMTCQYLIESCFISKVVQFQTLENLIDLSDAVLENKSNSHEKSSEKMSRQYEVPRWKMDSEDPDHFGREVDECELARQQMEKMTIQKEIMSSLFILPQKESENECGDPYSGRTYKPIREVVYEHPPKIFAVEEKTEETKPEKNDSVEQLGKEEEEDEYQRLRKAVTEYRDTMREYYKAAIEAYSKGDRARANKLSEKGQFFYRKAREADEESTRKVCEIRNADARDEDIFPLNLSELDAREALHIMKLHLKSLAGSLAFKYMKVTIEGPNGDVSRGTRRRRIMKLMDMKSIHWLDGGDPGTILIPLSINEQKPI